MYTLNYNSPNSTSSTFGLSTFISGGEVVFLDGSTFEFDASRSSADYSLAVYSNGITTNSATQTKVRKVKDTVIETGNWVLETKVKHGSRSKHCLQKKELLSNLKVSKVAKFHRPSLEYVLVLLPKHSNIFLHPSYPLFAFDQGSVFVGFKLAF